MEDSFISSLLILIARLTSIYIDKFVAFGKSLGPTPLFNRFICIVGREHCYECVRELPIGRVDEAISAAKLMEDIAPFDGVKFILAERLSAESTLIYFFVIRQPIYQLMTADAWFIIPETMLIKAWMDKHKPQNGISLKVEMANRELLVYKSVKEFRSSVFQQASSGKTNAVSISAEGEETVIDSPGYQKILISGLSNLPLFAYKQIFNSIRAKSLCKGIPWLNGGLTFGTLLVAYLSLSSLYVYIKGDYLNTQLTEQRQNLDLVFSLQNKLEQKLNTLQQLSKNDKLQAITSNVWPVVVDLINNDVELLSLRYETGEFIARAKANKSTQIMEALSKIKEIGPAEMVSPVAKSRGEEIVTVKFVLLNNSEINAGGEHVVTQ